MLTLERTALTGALTALVLGFGTVASAQVRPTGWEDHLLGRYGYGYDNWTLQRLRDKGRRGYVNEQLDPASIPDPVIGRAFSEPQFEALRMTIPELRATFKNMTPKTPGHAYQQARRAWMLRMVSSRRQLQMLMTEFWFNHFNVGNVGGAARLWIIHYAHRTIKNRVFGKFEDLLIAVTRAPAMLDYLDNRVNFKKGFKRGGVTYDINENFAREVMELHTLGVTDQAGVYDGADIIALAKALTGWTTANGTDKDGFQFLSAGHDTTAKQVIGLKLPAGGGYAEGVKALKYLANHWRTRHHLAAKMVRFLAGPGHPDLVKRARQKWKDSGGNLKAVTRLILMSKELAQARDKKVKRPTLFIASALRASGAQLKTGDERVTTLKRALNYCAAAGLPVFEVPPPTGWTDSNREFASAGTMLERINRMFTFFAASKPWVTTGFNPSRSTAGETVTNVGDRIFGTNRITKQTRAALVKYWNSSTLSKAERGRTVLSLALSSDEFAKY